MNPSNAKLNFSCIFNIGRTTYVDFFPFYNSEGGTELNILRAIIHYKKYELLTHPVCELFLHLKARRARNFYWMNNFLSFLFTILAAIYVFASYGHWDGDDVYNITCYDINDTVSETTEVCHFQNACYTYYLNIPLMILSLLNLFLNFFKYMQDPSSILNLNHWRSVPEEYFHILTFAFICIDQICMPIKYHQLLVAWLHSIHVEHWCTPLQEFLALPFSSKPLTTSKRVLWFWSWAILHFLLDGSLLSMFYLEVTKTTVLMTLVQQYWRFFQCFFLNSLLINHFKSIPSFIMLRVLMKQSITFLFSSFTFGSCLKCVSYWWIWPLAQQFLTFRYGWLFLMLLIGD